MCYFPESQVATSPALARARTIMQLMAVGLFIVCLFALLAGQLFFIVYGLFLSYMLYIGWARFDYTWTLYFFLFCCMQAVIAQIWFIGMIQYFKQIKDKDTLQILLGVAKMAYFFNAVFFSHYCYKIFKNNAYTTQIGNSYELMPVNNSKLNNLGSSQLMSPNNAVRDQIRREGTFQPFQGTGVSIA